MLRYYWLKGVTFLLLVNNLWKTGLGVHIQPFMENFLVGMKDKVAEFVKFDE